MEKAPPPAYHEGSSGSAPSNSAMNYQNGAAPQYCTQPMPAQTISPAYAAPNMPTQPMTPTYPGPVGANTTVIVASPQATLNLPFESTRIVCPFCRATIDTAVEQSLSTKGWIIALLLLGPCCCIPCCIDSCHDVRHHCPNCQAFLGERRA